MRSSQSLRSQPLGMWVCALLPGLAVAQALPSEPVTTLKAVEVTAQKRVQPLDEVPVSLQWLDGESIRQQNLKDTSAIGGQVINVKITQNTAEGTPPAINIRGVGNLDYNTSTTSPIGLYVDEVGGGTSNYQLVNLYDIEAIEVLRGPQGTLFGRNTTGGALLISTRKPDDGFGGYLSAGIGEYNLYKLGGAINWPVGEQVAMRLAFDNQKHDYSLRNLHAPAPTPDLSHNAARLSLAADYQPLEVQAKVHVERWDGVGKPVRHIGVFRQLADPVTGTPAILCSPDEAGSTACTDAFGFNVGSNDLSDVAANSEVHGGSPNRTDSWGADVRLSYALDEHSYLVSVSGFNALDRVHHYNADASPFRLAEGSLAADGHVLSQELRYHLDRERYYFIAGVYLEKEVTQQDFFIDVFRDFRASPDLFAFAAKFFYDNRIEPESQAAFANLDFRLSPDSTLTAGLRYTREHTRYHAIGHVNVATGAGDDAGLLVPAWDVAGEVSDNNLSGKLAFNHQWSEQANTWVSLARGFKSGGYNGAIAFSAEEAQRNDYGSETLDALEVGGNVFWDERNAQLQFSLFYYDYRNQQVFMNTPSVLPNAPPLQLLDNVGRSRIYGSELELRWQLTESLNARIGLGWLPKAELEEFVDASGQRVLGNRLPFTSEWNANLFLDHRRPLRNGELSLQLDGVFQSEFYFDQNQNPYTRQGGYTLWNSRIAYQQGPWTGALWVKNLADRGYSNMRFDLINFLGLVQDNRGERRQWGIDVEYRF
ncbi:MAG TPA: TonB-dependent receptor [Arenimonas sp.]|nr:TonB-dependent receptor [Arenimonas sp.]